MSEVNPRRRAREIALQVLFQREFVPEMEVAQSLSYFRENIVAPKESWEYAEMLLNGVLRMKEQLDTLITEKSRNWKIGRMAPVDLCLLRMATFEICFGQEVPPKVAINEAIEIAKRYSGTESSQFINGVLDEIKKTRE